MKHSLVVTATTLMMLALAACGGEDPEPRFAPPETSSPTEQPSESPTSPPTSPPVTAEPKPLSPEETVRAWVEARNVAVRTGDPSQVQALSARECTTCEQSVDPVVAIYQAGGQFETTGWSVPNTKRDPAFDSNGEVPTALIYAAGQTIPKAGAPPITYAEERHIAVFRLSRRGSSWAVNQIVYLS